MKEKQRINYAVARENAQLIVAGLAIALALLLVLLLHQEDEIDISSFVDLTIVTAIVFMFLLNWLARYIADCWWSHRGDRNKLETDYQRLCSIYRCSNKSLVTYENLSTDGNSRSKVTFPEVVVARCILPGQECHRTIKIVDERDKQYELPEDLKSEVGHIMEAHRTSEIFNSLCIRVDKIECNGNEVCLYSSRTSYFNSLLTNRSMDYRWSNGMTTRDVYAFGPFAPTLEKSKLSNHLGINGFVITSDNKAVLVHRFKNVSIGKRTWGVSIGASCKAQYALSEDDGFSKSKRLDREGLRRAIVKEAYDELGITEEESSDFSLDEHVVAFYLDLIEGGKPQLLFYLPVNLTFEEINSRFMGMSRERVKKERSRHSAFERMKMDGDALDCLDLSHPEDVRIETERIVGRNSLGERKSFVVMPTVSASLALFFEAFLIDE